MPPRATEWMFEGDQPLPLDDGFHAPAAGFLTWLRRARPGPDGTLLIEAGFDAGKVSDALYDRCGIARPDGFPRWVPRRRAEYLAGRLAAGAALANLGQATRDVTSDADRVPVWPPGIHGSISHSRHHAVCMLSQTHPVIGVDTEEIVQGDPLAAILETALSAEERGLIATHGDPDPALATLVFSAKETVYKALYPQIRTYFGFEALQLEKAPRPDRLRLRLQTGLTTDLPAGLTFEPRYRIASGRVLTWLAAGSLDRPGQWRLRSDK